MTSILPHRHSIYKVGFTGRLPDIDFDHYLEQFFSDLGSADHLILGISDTTPPAAEFERIRRIGDLVRQFGPVNP